MTDTLAFNKKQTSQYKRNLQSKHGRTISFNLKAESILINISQNLQADFSIVRDVFDELNQNRNQNSLKEYYPKNCYRILERPIFRENCLDLYLSPINYAFIAIMKDSLASQKAKSLVSAELSQTSNGVYVTEANESKDAFNVDGFDLIGVLTCLITCDGYILLRRRSSDVLTARNRWDVSFGGHPNENSTNENGKQLDLIDAIVRESSQEIGEIKGKSDEIRFTGLHRNLEYGDYDLLSYWKIENTVDEISQMLSQNGYSKYNSNVFKTTVHAEEMFVWDTNNLLLPFKTAAIQKIFKANNITFSDFASESFACLNSALQADNQPPLVFDYAVDS